MLRKVPHGPYVVAGTASIREALEKINEQSGSPCLVQDSDGSCLGLVADGDIRRALLANSSLEDPIRSLTGTFWAVSQGATEEHVFKEMRRAQVGHLPILDNRGRLSGLWISDQLTSWRTFDLPVLVLAGGKGARLHPLTISRPKPLIKVGEVTLLDRTIEKCVSHGYRRFYLSVNYLKDQVIAHFEGNADSEYSIEFLEEDIPLGTAGPVGLMPKDSEGNLLVVNADVIHNVDLARMMESHQNSGASMTVAIRLHQTTIPFGVVELDGNQIVGVSEKPTLNFPVSAGIYILGQQIREMIQPGVPLDMPDVIDMAISEGLTVETFLAHEYWLDVGTHESLALAELEIDQWKLGGS